MLPQDRASFLDRLLRNKKPQISTLDRKVRIQAPGSKPATSGFGRVQLSDNTQYGENTRDQKIEIRFPDGVHITLSGSGSLSAAKSILTLL